MKKYFLIIAAVIVVAILAITGTLYIQLSSQLKYISSELAKASEKITYQDTQIREEEQKITTLTVKIAENENQLASSQKILATTLVNLSATTEALDGVRKQLDTTQTELEYSKSQLARTTVDLNAVTGKLNEANGQIGTLQGQVSAMQSSINLYKDTFGEVHSGEFQPYTVYDSVVPGKARGANMLNNTLASNPAWTVLEDFLIKDKTDQNDYVDGSYVCGNYAEEVHNNAEKSGIRAAVVTLTFSDGTGHALNAFKTIDRGLVFVDCTGVQPSSSVKPSSMDTTVDLKKSRPYTRKFLLSIVGSGFYFPPSTFIVTSIATYW